MKVLLLSLLSAVALGLEFNTDSTCTSYESACTGSASDFTTCVGQDAWIKIALAQEGIDVTTATWTLAGAQAVARRAHEVNWNNNGVFDVHIDLERVLRCTFEANNIVWSQATTCFAEWGSCMTDPVCAGTWDVVANTSKVAAGIAFTYVQQGIQALGAVPFTLVQDATGGVITPMTNEQVGGLVAVADMAGNGKIMAMMSCMLKDWAAVDIQTAYIPCFDVAVACSNDADCAAASEKVKTCAADAKEPVSMTPNAMLTNIMEPPATATHDDWCTVSACAGEEGNSLYMALGTCLMDAGNMSYTKCYDDMMAHIFMMIMVVGGVSFAVGVLMFTAAWCMCCKSSKGAEMGVSP